MGLLMAGADLRLLFVSPRRLKVSAHKWVMALLSESLAHQPAHSPTRLRTDRWIRTTVAGHLLPVPPAYRGYYSLVRPAKPNFAGTLINPHACRCTVPLRAFHDRWCLPGLCQLLTCASPLGYGPSDFPLTVLANGITLAEKEGSPKTPLIQPNFKECSNGQLRLHITQPQSAVQGLRQQN